MFTAVGVNLDMVRSRINKGYRLDNVVVEGLIILAKKQNISTNRLVENMLMDGLKKEGIIDSNLEPLGETRGGDHH